MAGIIADVSEDIRKLQQIKAEIASVKQELKSIDIRVRLDLKENIETRLQSLMKQYNEVVLRIAKVEGEAMLAATKIDEAINGISSDPLISFDAELMKMCSNLNKYFDDLLAKMESMSSLLQVGKTGIDGSTSNNVPTQQLEDLRIKNAELTEQLRSQKEEIKQQQEEWNRLATAIKTNNVSAIEQYKQATNSSSDAVKTAKLELKDLTKDLNENIKYYDTLAAQIASYKSILDRLYSAKEKGMTRVPIGDGATALISSELERFKPQLDDVTQKSKEIASQISEQRKRQAELNTVIEQGNEKHARTRTLILDAREQLVQMRSAGLQNTAQYQQIGQEAAKMRTQMALVNAEMEYLSNPNKGLLTLKTGLQGIAGSASLVVGIMGFFNQKSEEMVQIQTKIQSLLGIIVGLENSYNMVKKSSVLLLAIEEVQRKALIASQALEAKAKTTNIALTWSEVAAQKAFNLVAKVNPYLILSAAILTVVGGIWLLVKANKEATNTTKDLLSAEQEMASARKKAISDSTKERTELDLLYNKLKGTSLSTKERTAAVNEWMKKYPQHSNIMNGELVSLGKLESAYQSLSKQIIESAKARAYADKITELETKKDEALLKRRNQYVTYLKAIDDYDKAVNEYNEKKETGFGTATSKLEAENKILRAEQNIKNQKKAWMDLISETKAYEQSISIISKKIKVDDLYPQPEEGTHDYWQQQVQIADVALKQIKDEYLSVLKGGNTKEISTKVPDDVVQQYNALVKQKKEAEEKLKIYDDDSSKQESAAEKLRKQQEKLTEEIKKSAQVRKEALIQSEMDIQQQVIDLKKEGSEKELAQIQLNYDKQYYEIAKRERELLEKLQEEERKQWQKDNPNHEKKGLKFTPQTTSLTPEQREPFDKEYSIAFQKQERDTQALLNKLLEKYRDYDAQRTAIEKEGNEEIAYLQEKRTDANAEEIDRAIAVAKQKMKEGVQAITDTEASKTAEDNPFLKNLFGDISQMAFKDLQNLIEQAKQVQSYLSGTGDSKSITFISPEQLKIIAKSPDELDKLKKAIDKLLKGEKGNEWDDIFEGFTKGFAKLKSAKGFKEVSEGMQDIGQAAYEASSMLANVSGSLASMFEEMGNTEAADAMTGVQDAMGAISNIGQGFAKGGIVGGIAAAVGEAANFIGKAFAANARHKAALKEIMNETLAQQREYNLLLMQQNLEYEKATTIFGTDTYGKAVNAIKVMKDAVADLNKELVGTTEQKGKQPKNTFDTLLKKFFGVSNPQAELKKAYAGLADIEIKTGHKKTGLFGWGKGKDIYSSILSVYPELIDANGKFNTSLAETIINTREMSDEDKAAFQNMIDLSKQAEEALKAVNDYLTDIFGELGNTMSDALVDAFANGTDAAQAFTDSVSNMLETLAKQMIYSVTLAPIIEKAQGQMMEVMKNTGLSDEEKFKQWTGILDNLVGEAIDQQDYANRLFGKFQQAAKDKGFDIFSPDSSSSQSATNGGFQAMSQDTGEELNGRFTALQVAGEEIKNQTIQQTGLLSSINEKISLLNLTNEDIPGLTANIPDIAGQTRESITSSYQPQMQIIFPTEGLEVLADKMSSMERIVDEMRVIQIEKFTDVAEGINRMTKNAPVVNIKLDNINENIKKVL